MSDALIFLLKLFFMYGLEFGTCALFWFASTCRNKNDAGDDKGF